MTKVLIVDDSDVLRAEVRATLEEAGYEVVEAENGALGLTMAEQVKDFSIILTDLNMPEMNGVTMAGKIHQLEHYKAVPIFMLTTEGSAELKAKGKEAGVMLWMVKPFKPELLIKAVSKVLSTVAA